MEASLKITCGESKEDEEEEEEAVIEEEDVDERFERESRDLLLARMFDAGDDADGVGVTPLCRSMID